MNKIKIALKTDEPAHEVSVQRFEELFGIRYLTELEFANWQVEQDVRAKCAGALKKGRVGQLALWLGKLHGKLLESQTIPEITIRWIGPEIGYGAFTNKSFKKWEFIGEYTGTLRRRRLIFPDVNDYCFMYPKEWRALKAFTIDSDKVGCLTRYINHSDFPNCESVSIFHDGIFHIIFRAIQEIPEGTELTYDYGDIYWSRRKKLPEEPIEDLIDPDDLRKLQS